MHMFTLQKWGKLLGVLYFEAPKLEDYSLKNLQGARKFSLFPFGGTRVDLEPLI